MIGLKAITSRPAAAVDAASPRSLRCHAVSGLAAACLLLGALPATGSELTLSVDDPADLGGTTFLSNQTVHERSGVYSLRFDGPAAGLPAGISINALALREDGSFLFVPDAPFDDLGTVYGARDIVEWSGGGLSLFRAGDDMGLSPAAQIDALARLPDGTLAVSFAAPESVGGTTFMPEDVAKLDGLALSAWFDGSGEGLPEGTDVVGYDTNGAGDEFLLFGEPTTVAGTTYLPGEVVRYDGVTYQSHWVDPSFPAGAAASALSLPGSPGDAGGLLVDKQGPDLTMTWDASCSSESNDFAVFEGTLGDFASHEPVVCSTSGATNAVVPAGGSNHYYLVTPMNGMFEGSYGTAWDGSERAASASPCQAEQRVDACP